MSYPQCGVGKVVGVGVLETGMVSSYDVVAVVTMDTSTMGDMINIHLILIRSLLEQRLDSLGQKTTSIIRHHRHNVV